MIFAVLFLAWAMMYCAWEISDALKKIARAIEERER